MTTAWLARSLAAVDALCSLPRAFAVQRTPSEQVCRLAKGLLQAASDDELSEPDVNSNLNGLAIEWHHSSGSISMHLDNDQIELGVSSGTWMAMWPPMHRTVYWEHQPDAPELMCRVVDAFLVGASPAEIGETVATWSRLSKAP